MALEKTLADLAGMVTRREGRKFLKLDESVDEGVLAGAGGNEGVSLYIHIPYCRTLCPFCCFNRYLFREDEARRYFVNLKKELDLYIRKGFRFSHFYFGGGTPTILMDELAGFIDYLRENFAVKQISLETSPREIDRENIALLKAAGINRLSIGVQSFDPGLLKSMGRPLTSPEALREILLMAEGEFDTLNIDLVFNFPGQTVAQFEADVATFKELGIDQVTFYPLMPSPHKKDAMERRFNRVDTSREKRFYDVILRDVHNRGYRASTVWCFSRGERMIDEYIVEDDDYVGIGAGSVSVVGGNFYVNSFPPGRYGELVNSGRLPVIGWRALSPGEQRRYYLLTKLFGTKVDEGDFYRRFHTGIRRALRREMLALKLFGLVEGSDVISVTPKGMYPVSVMMREFFASLNSLREYCIEKQI